MHNRRSSFSIWISVGGQIFNTWCQNEREPKDEQLCLAKHHMAKAWHVHQIQTLRRRCVGREDEEATELRERERYMGMICMVHWLLWSHGCARKTQTERVRGNVLCWTEGGLLLYFVPLLPRETRRFSGWIVQIWFSQCLALSRIRGGERVNLIGEPPENQLRIEPGRSHQHRHRTVSTSQQSWIGRCQENTRFVSCYHSLIAAINCLCDCWS